MDWVPPEHLPTHTLMPMVPSADVPFIPGVFCRECFDARPGVHENCREGLGQMVMMPYGTFYFAWPRDN